MHKQTRGSTRLRAWMAKNGMNQKQVGAQIGVHQTMVGQWLLGRPISLKHAVALQKVTKIRAEDWTVDADAADVSPSPQRAAS